MFDVSRFEKLYREYYAPIFEYCLTKLSFDRDAAAEAADNVFVTVYRKWDRLEIGGNVKYWLYRAADNGTDQPSEYTADDQCGQESHKRDHAVHRRSDISQNRGNKSADDVVFLSAGVKNLLLGFYTVFTAVTGRSLYGTFKTDRLAAFIAVQ